MTLHRYITAGILVMPMLLAGCAVTATHQGQVVRPQIGTPYMDFTYVDANGRPQQLSEHLGDYTVLSFTKCGGDLHGPVSRQLAALVRVTEEPGIVRTIGFDIHWSENGCQQGKSCHLIKENWDLYSICDAGGIVRDLSGVQQNKIFVIGPDGKIEDVAPASKFDELKSRFKRIVRDYAAEKRSMLPQDL